jgi:hypothetical protein
MGDDIINVKGGVLDSHDWVKDHGKPFLEVYVDRRIGWVPKMDGLLQLNAKYEVVEGVVPPGMADRKAARDARMAEGEAKDT